MKVVSQKAVHHVKKEIQINALNALIVPHSWLMELAHVLSKNLKKMNMDSAIIKFMKKLIEAKLLKRNLRKKTTRIVKIDVSIANRENAKSVWITIF